MKSESSHQCSSKKVSLETTEKELLRAGEMNDAAFESLRLTRPHCTRKRSSLRKSWRSTLGASKKIEIVSRLLALAKIRALKSSVPEAADGNVGGNEEACLSGLSYVTEDIQSVLQALPRFDGITEWTKQLLGLLKEFSFKNLLVYLVYGRDKAFVMKTMKAYKSALKPTRIFLMVLFTMSGYMHFS